MIANCTAKAEVDCKPAGPEALKFSGVPYGPALGPPAAVAAGLPVRPTVERIPPPESLGSARHSRSAWASLHGPQETWPRPGLARPPPHRQATQSSPAGRLGRPSPSPTTQSCSRRLVSPLACRCPVRPGPACAGRPKPGPHTRQWIRHSAPGAAVQVP